MVWVLDALAWKTCQVHMHVFPKPGGKNGERNVTEPSLQGETSHFPLSFSPWQVHIPLWQNKTKQSKNKTKTQKQKTERKQIPYEKVIRKRSSVSHNKNLAELTTSKCGGLRPKTFKRIQTFAVWLQTMLWVLAIWFISFILGWLFLWGSVSLSAKLTRYHCILILLFIIWKWKLMGPAWWRGG